MHSSSGMHAKWLLTQPGPPSPFPPLPSCPPQIPLLPDATRRLAAVDLDWDHVRAVDILAVLRSFVPKGGAIQRVVVYPSGAPASPAFHACAALAVCASLQRCPPACLLERSSERCTPHLCATSMHPVPCPCRLWP